MPGSSALRFRVLDSWRGICALLVAAHHIEVHSAIYWQPLIRNAWLFVDFFFVLSGFVIAHAYGEKLQAGSQVKSFVIRRFGRLWPLHATMLLAMIALEAVRIYAVRAIPAADAHTAFAGEHSPFAILTNLFLVQALGMHDYETWNGPAWSISVEFATYLVFALVCFAAQKRGTRLILCAVLALGGAAVLAAFSDYGMRETFHWPLFRCFYGFFLGVLTYEAWNRFKVIGGTLAELMVLAAIAIFLTFAPGTPGLEYLATPLFAVAVLVFAQEGGLVSRALVTRMPLALGRWSYSIYMVHTLVLALLFSAVHAADVLLGSAWMVRRDSGVVIGLGSETANDLLILAFLAVVVGSAALTYSRIERPGQRFFNRLASAKRVEIEPRPA